MSETNLPVLLNKIGKGIFVEYFREFYDSKLSNQDVIALLPQEFTFKSRTSRTSKSRRIFREGLEKEALRIIAESGRVDPEASKKAAKLLALLGP